jgi:RNA polymerase sigma-70 factor (ECF subfamily)
MRRPATALGGEIDLPAADTPQNEHADARTHTVALFRDLREPLGRYLASQGVNSPEVEELVQETFLRLHRHLASGQADTQNLKGWVFRVALNLVRDRHRGWHGRNIDSIEDRPEAAFASAPGATPEERLLRREKVERLRIAWQALPDLHRRCLHLRAEGLRYREIAAALGVSITTVADLIRNSLAQLGRARDDD